MEGPTPAMESPRILRVVWFGPLVGGRCHFFSFAASHRPSSAHLGPIKPSTDPGSAEAAERGDERVVSPLYCLFG